MSKVGLRRKGASLTGMCATTNTTVLLADGSTVPIRVGDWRIFSGHMVLAVLPAKEFPGPYEIVAEGTLTLTQPDRELLEATTGVGTTLTATTLIAAVQRLARIAIGDVVVPFTPGQLEEIVLRARKRGITVQRAMLDVIDRIKSDLFHGA